MSRPHGHRIDKLDIRIIGELQKQPRLSYQELGKLVNLTYTPCRRRVQWLFSHGYITSAIAIQTQKFSSKRSYCILVEMGDTSRGAIEFFIDKTKLIKEVDICWELNGSWDFVLRLHVEEEAQFEPLRRTINDLAISGFKIVRRTQSFLIAAFVKGNLPIEALSISPPDKEHDT